MYRHPLDQQNTRLLRLLPGLEGLIKGLIGGAGETILLLENMGSSILVGPDQVWSQHQASQCNLTPGPVVCKRFTM
jgi:hypothetical protein